jgi:hypothetical protein
LASLSRTRALIRGRKARLLVIGIVIAYLLTSMFIGQMLTFPAVQGPFFIDLHFGGSPWWDFPELFVFGSGVALDLLFLPTVTMVLVSLAVGIGATAAVVTVLPALRAESASRRTAATTSAAGAGAAITGLATIGACCCTSCAGAIGVAVVAAASGTDMAVLLRENWYIDLFQLVVVGIALLAQERALRLPADYCPIPPKTDRRFVLGSLLRIGLLVAGITWSLAMFVEWIDLTPLTASAATWYHWIFEHQFLSAIAIAAGMFPKEFAGWIERTYRSSAGSPLRAVLLFAGVTWGIWVPQAFTNLGLGGLVNEIFGFLGFTPFLGSISPDAAIGAPLLFHWGFQHVLLAAFAIIVAVRPHLATAPLLRTVEGPPESAIGHTAVPGV